MKVEIYSDVACPWCYIGKRRFERALVAHPRADAVDVVFRPYQLDPSAPETAVPLRTHLVHKFGRSAEQMAAYVAAAARSEGIEMDFDAARSVNTLAAHRLLRLAELEHGREVQHAVAARLFDVYFSAGLDIGDVEVCSALAARSRGERGEGPCSPRARTRGGGRNPRRTQDDPEGGPGSSAIRPSTATPPSANASQGFTSSSRMEGCSPTSWEMRWITSSTAARSDGASPRIPSSSLMPRMSRTISRASTSEMGCTPKVTSPSAST
jgi:2-hydroxychromene-2-carboxylate isomerase